MSYDRVLPNPVAHRYETAQVPSNILDHTLNDLKSVAMQDYDSRAVHMISNPERVKPGPMLSTKELPLRDRSDRSSSSSAGSNSPVKAKDCSMQFCLCQPDPKIPRPRNGESITSIPSSELGKCFFLSNASLLGVWGSVASLNMC